MQSEDKLKEIFFDDIINPIDIDFDKYFIKRKII